MKACGCDDDGKRKCEACAIEALRACKSDCDCGQDTEPGSTAHHAGCNSQRECGEGGYCDRHSEEAMREHAWMSNVSIGAVTGKLSARDERDLREAGRGHLVMS